MPQAQITINAVIGSDTDLPIDTVVQLDNNNIGGEVSYLWSILDQPTGAADSLSNATIQNPTFTPQKEGTYLVQLIVNQGLPDEDVDTVVASVKLLKSRERVPAAGEQVEASTSRGWAADVNKFLRSIDDALADPVTIVGANTDASPMAKGTVIRVTSGQTIKPGLPGEEIVPGFVTAPATSGTNVDELLAVIEEGVDGSDPVPIGALAKARALGRVPSLALGAGAVGDPVFVTDTATISTTPGTVRRQIGSIMAINGVNRDVWVDGTQGGEGAPVDRAFVVYGNPGTLPNATRIDGLNATGSLNNIPYVFRAGDDLTPALVAKRSSGTGQDIQQWQDEVGTILARVTVDGKLRVGDLNFGLTFKASPELIFDVGDSLRYDRSANAFLLYIGGSEILRFAVSGSNPYLRFDSNDQLLYDASGNAYLFQIGGSTKLKVASVGANILGGLVVGSTTHTPTSGTATIAFGLDVGFLDVPASNEVRVGDPDFGLSAATITIPRLKLSHNSGIEYVRSTDVMRFICDNQIEAEMLASGMRIRNGLYVGNIAGTPVNDEIIAAGAITAGALITGTNLQDTYLTLTPATIPAGVVGRLYNDATSKTPLVHDGAAYQPINVQRYEALSTSNLSAVGNFAHTHAVPANTLRVGSTVRVKAAGFVNYGSGVGTVSIAVRLGGTTVANISQTISSSGSFFIDSVATIRGGGFMGAAGIGGFNQIGILEASSQVAVVNVGVGNTVDARLAAFGISGSVDLHQFVVDIN